MVIIEYYKSPSDREPVKDFIDSLSPKDKSRIFRGLSLLEEFWPCLGMPHAKNIAGHPGLWELRVDGEKKTFRIFFGQAKSKIGLVHAVVKKSQRLSPKDIRLAAERLKEWKEVQGE